MDKNSIIGLLIIALILIIMGYLNKPSQEEIERARQQKDSLKQTQQEQVEKQPSEERKTSPADKQEKEQEPTQKETDKKSSEEDLKNRYGSFATAAEGEKNLIVLENNKMKVKLSTKGGRPYSVRLKEYKTYDKEPLILFDGDDNKFGFNFFADNRKISTNDLYFKYPKENDSIVARHNEQSVQLRLYACVYFFFCLVIISGTNIFYLVLVIFIAYSSEIVLVFCPFFKLGSIYIPIQV